MRLRVWFVALLGGIMLSAGWLGNAPRTTWARPMLAEDCISYNPATLTIVNEGAGGWLLTDGSSRMQTFASQADAQLGLQVARLYTQQCYIGRGNTRPDRSRYIFLYWKGSSGLSGTLPTNDCIPYERDSLSIANEGADGWVLTSSTSRIKMFDNQVDAQAGLDLLRSYDRVCYIGRGTGQVMTYLYADVHLLLPAGPLLPVVPVEPVEPLLPVFPAEPVLPPAVAIPAEDCITYNPASLSIIDQGANGWLLTDGTMAMRLFDTQADAQLGLRVAQAHTQQCFIGRSNTRPERSRYIWEYWQGDSGLGIVLPDNDCLTHNPATLTVADQGANGWLVTDGASAIALFDTQGDAILAKSIMAAYDQNCYIGRGNSRPDRYAYIMTYLRQSVMLGPPPVMPAGEDCLAYDPFALTLSDQGALGWILTDGTSSMMLLDDLPDAQLAANVAMAHTQQCFVGRDNTRPDRYAYIFEYWKGDSGLGLEPPLDDCLTYNPASLTLADGGANGWYVLDGAHTILLMDTQADADAARQAMLAHTMICYIGRDNIRPDRSHYVHTYLRDTPAPSPLPTPVPTLTPMLPPCASAPPPRMIVNHIGRVTFSTGEPVRVRTGPGTGNSILTLLPEGTIFYVTGGPICGEPYWWWSVQTGTGIIGWMAEGVVGNYFIEPFGP